MRIPLRRRPNIIRLTVPPPPGVPHGDGWGLGERLIAPDKLLSEQNPMANELRGCGLSRIARRVRYNYLSQNTFTHNTYLCDMKSLFRLTATTYSAPNGNR